MGIKCLLRDLDCLLNRFFSFLAEGALLALSILLMFFGSAFLFYLLCSLVIPMIEFNLAEFAWAVGLSVISWYSGRGLMKITQKGEDVLDPLC